MDDTTRLVAEMADALSRLPGGNKPGTLEVTCELPEITCVCGKKVPDIAGLDMLNTGVIIAVNNVCKHCKEGHKYDASKARFVCVKCKRVVMHVPPTKDKVDGFEFKAGHNYHVEGCPQCCNVEEGEFKIIEKYLHKKKLGKK